jgi:hypothetical protein
MCEAMMLYNTYQLQKDNLLFDTPLDISNAQLFFKFNGKYTDNRIKDGCNARLELCLWDLNYNYIISLGGKQKASQEISGSNELLKERLF